MKLVQRLPLNGLKGVIFDCDGVLFNSKRSNVCYYNAILSKMGLGPMDSDQESYVHAHAVQESLKYITPQERWGEIPEARGRVNYFTEILPFIDPEPGVFDFLSRVRDAGYLMGVCTNRTNTMERLAWKWGLERFFSPIMTAMKTAAKPHPEMVHRTLAMWRVRPDEVAYIGDTSVDEKTAHAAGVRFWAYKNPKLQAEFNAPDYWTFARAMGLKTRSVARWGADMDVYRGYRWGPNIFFGMGLARGRCRN